MKVGEAHNKPSRIRNPYIRKSTRFVSLSILGVLLFTILLFLLKNLQF
jgi:hypothetical protein